MREREGERERGDTGVTFPWGWGRGGDKPTLRVRFSATNNVRHALSRRLLPSKRVFAAQCTIINEKIHACPPTFFLNWIYNTGQSDSRFLAKKYSVRLKFLPPPIPFHLVSPRSGHGRAGGLTTQEQNSHENGSR